LKKLIQIGWYGHVERMKNRRMPKEIVRAIMEGTRKRGRPRKRWRETRLRRS
jgi:hypothetical protein